MKPRNLVVSLLLAAGVLVGGRLSLLWAAGPEDLKADAEKLMERARDLKVEGRMEESEQTAAKAKQLFQQSREKAEMDRNQERESGMASAGRPEGPREGRRPGWSAREQGIRDADVQRREQRRGRGDRIEPQFEPRRELGEPQPGERPLDRREAEERLDHLRQAIGHLHAAGLHATAERLDRAAEQMQRRVEMARESRQRMGPPAPGASERQLEAMRAQLSELRDRMADLQRGLEKTREALKRHVDEARP